MKRTVLIGLSLLPVLGLAQENPFSLKASLGKNYNSSKVYLSYREAGKVMLDSAIITNGVFQFSGSIAGPVKAQLVIDNRGLGLRLAVRADDVALEKAGLA